MTRKIEIETDVPLPRARTPKGTFNFVLRMQPGHSVLAESIRERNAILARGKAVGWTMRSEKENDGWRIWRGE